MTDLIADDCFSGQCGRCKTCRERDTVTGLRAALDSISDEHASLRRDANAMRPVVQAVLAMKHADGLHPEHIGRVMEAIERYEEARDARR